MPRNAEKLYEELDALEAEFAVKLRKSLKKETTTGAGFDEYLHRKQWSAFFRHDDEHADRMDYLEKRIGAIRSKLGEPEDAGPLSYVAMFLRERDGNCRREAEIASEVLRRLENGIPAATEILGRWQRNRKVEFIKDRLPKNLRYPCEIRDIKDVIALLPPEDMESIRTVHFCHHKAMMEGQAVYSRSTIELNYTVDDHLRRLVLEGEPSPRYIKEWEQYGGTYLVEGGKRYVQWESMDHAKRYVYFVFLHEVGHFVFLQTLKRGPIPYKQSEMFANEYAYRQLKLIENR